MLNQGIKAETVRIITDDGEQLTLSRTEALQRAQDEGLDLYLVSPNTNPPVAKILDYGHYKYVKEKKQKDAKKKNSQKGNTIKELKLTPRIGIHDFKTRVKRAKEFLGKGYKVKLTIFFKGREATHQELGVTMIQRFLDEIEELGWAENPDFRPRLVGRFMSILIVAGKKRPVVVEEQEIEKEEIENKEADAPVVEKVEENSADDVVKETVEN